MALQKHHSKQAPAAKQTTAAKPATSVPRVKRQQAQGDAPEQRHQMIAMAAYLIAEQRGFQGDMAMNDWLQAEAAVDARFEAQH
ncbi:MAG: DUF2934 domain-containing protein [Gammaproteobacteria bacterium]